MASADPPILEDEDDDAPKKREMRAVGGFKIYPERGAHALRMGGRGGKGRRATKEEVALWGRVQQLEDEAVALREAAAITEYSRLAMSRFVEALRRTSDLLTACFATRRCLEAGDPKALHGALLKTLQAADLLEPAAAKAVEQLGVQEFRNVTDQANPQTERNEDAEDQ
jgi:hypothetical protein